VLLLETVEEEVDVLEAVVVEVGLVVDEDVDVVVGPALEEVEGRLVVEDLLFEALLLLEEVVSRLLLLVDDEVLDAVEVVVLMLGELCDDEELTLLLLLLPVPVDVVVEQLLEALDELTEEGANAATASFQSRTASTSVTPLIGALVAQPSQPTTR
jgi:hypothetical protein